MSDGGPGASRKAKLSCSPPKANAGLDLAGVAALAIVALFITAGGADMYSAIGARDPWVYTGYIHDYGTTLARFGRTYYSTRVAALWPQTWAYDLFGDQAYRVIRWGVLMMCGGGVALALRRVGGRWVAYAGGIAMMCSAPLLLELADDYTQEVAIAYALLAIALLMRKSWVATAGAGVLASLALNAHEGALYLVVPAVLAIAVAFAVHAGILALARRAVAFVAGGFLIQLVLSLAMGLKYGWVRANWFFQEQSIDSGSELTNGGFRRWLAPWDNPWIMVTITVIAVGAWALLALVVGRIRRIPGREVLAPVTVALGAGIALILYSQFVVGMGFASHHIYSVFAITLATLAAWVALAALSRGRTARVLAIASGGSAVVISLIAPAVWQHPGTPWVIAWWVGIALATVMLVAVAVVRSAGAGRWALAISAAVVAGLLIPVGPLTTRPESAVGTGGSKSWPSYAGVTNASKETAQNESAGLAVHSLALQFQRYVNETIPTDTTFLVYYPKEDDLTSVQSVFLWLYTCLQCAKGAPAFPQFDTAARDQLVKTGPGALVIMSHRRADVTKAQQNAERAYPRLVTRLPIKQLSAPGSVIWVGISTVA